jgi:hypothetical protein
MNDYNVLVEMTITCSYTCKMAVTAQNWADAQTMALETAQEVKQHKGMWREHRPITPSFKVLEGDAWGVGEEKK